MPPFTHVICHMRARQMRECIVRAATRWTLKTRSNEMEEWKRHRAHRAGSRPDGVCLADDIDLTRANGFTARHSHLAFCPDCAMRGNATTPHHAFR